jgi:hypothetical protein
MFNEGVMATKFRKFHFCPICGGLERVSEPSGMAFYKADAGYHYLKHAANYLNITVQQLISHAHVYRCITCDTFYCDPWLESEDASFIFTVGASDHIAGWGTFENWLSSGNLSRGQSNVKKLHNFLCQRIGRISTYAELACPFQGLLLFYKGQEVQPIDRIKLFKKAIFKKADVRWVKVAQLHHYLSSIANSAAVVYLRIRSIKEYFYRKSCDSKIADLPTVRYLLTEDTSRGWGSNCVRYNGSCRYYAAETLSVNVLPLVEMAARVSSKSSSRIDLLGIFNSLDHVNFPILTIQNGLKLANNIIIVTHHARHAGKQHQFAFGEKFPDWLRTYLDDVNVEDITSSIEESGPRDNNYILISRR